MSLVPHKTSVPRSARHAEPLLFEIAWEVCRQVGGIYTVIRSKAPTMVEQWAKNYCLVGPWDPEASPLEFEPATPPPRLRDALHALQAEGIEAHFGHWIITGTPQVLLLNPRSAYYRLGEIKYLLWDHHDISLPAHDPLMDEVVAFGHCVERLFHALAASKVRRPVIAHFHEWLAGSAIPELRRAQLPLATVFTTHATQLGRVLAMNDPWFYDRLGHMDWLAEARRYNIEAPVRLERACAHGAHVLTTVSDVTGDECRHLLGRPPDLLTPNGLNIERFVAMHEFQNLHRVYKEQIHRLVMSMFFPSYTFDLDRTLYFFSSGRYEYRNKGFDLALEALARLNAMLRSSGSDRTVVFFLISKRPFRGINSEVLRRNAMLEEIARNTDSIKEQFAERLFGETARGRVPDYNHLIDDYWKLRLRRLMHTWKSPILPSVVTHDLLDDAHDEVLGQIRYLNLINLAEDRVKVVYHPDFVTSSSPLFGMDYDHFVRGCHLGVFPSFYEPWGYTPLECVARGVPAVTSDLSGFGTHVLQNMPDHWERGIFVAERRGRSGDAAAHQLAEWMLRFCQMERRDRIALRNRTESSADRFDWSRVGLAYIDAHAKALQIAGA